MATDSFRNTPAGTAVAALPGRRYDHVFFPAIAALMLVTVFIGFGPTYYLAGVFRAPLPSLTIHLHAVAFSCWILLLVVQTSLAAAGRVGLHRRLGVAGVVLAAAMVVLGVLAATDSLVRGAGPPGRDAKFFYIVPLSSIFMFGVLMVFAWRERSNSTAHKRLILVATTALLVAAIARWPIAAISRKILIDTWLSFLFLLFLVLYDLWSLRKVHRATLWAGVFLVGVSQLRFVVGRTDAWHSFAGWVQELAR